MYCSQQIIYTLHFLLNYISLSLSSYHPQKSTFQVHTLIMVVAQNEWDRSFCLLSHGVQDAWLRILTR